MNFWNSSGIVGYQAIIGLNTWILGLLWKRGLLPKYRFFSIYMAACLVANLVLFPLLLEYGLDAYSRAYWIANPLLLASEIMAIAEMWERPKWGILPAIGVLIAQAVLVAHLSNSAVEVQRLVMIGVAMASAPLAYKSLMALGFLMTSGILLLTASVSWMENAVDTRYLPTYIFVLANFLWVGSLIRLRPRDVKL